MGDRGRIRQAPLAREPRAWASLDCHSACDGACGQTRPPRLLASPYAVKGISPCQPQTHKPYPSTIPSSIAVVRHRARNAKAKGGSSRTRQHGGGEPGRGGRVSEASARANAGHHPPILGNQRAFVRPLQVHTPTPSTHLACPAAPGTPTTLPPARLPVHHAVDRGPAHAEPPGRVRHPSAARKRVQNLADGQGHGWAASGALGHPPPACGAPLAGPQLGLRHAISPQRHQLQPSHRARPSTPKTAAGLSHMKHAEPGNAGLGFECSRHRGCSGRSPAERA